VADGPATGGALAISRRTFFGRLFWGLATLIGLLVGVPTLGSIFSPAIRRQEKAQWIKVGPVSAFGAEPRLAHHVHPSQEGWVNVTGQMQVWVVRLPEGGFKIFDNHCTHLGCAYHWDVSRGLFICPCHNGVFNAKGDVVSGPPPRPLDYYEAKVEGEALYMGAFHRGGT
jgi:menaquinol-cytochrome c reductase iron-sulfur subunit